MVKPRESSTSCWLNSLHHWPQNGADQSSSAGSTQTRVVDPPDRPRRENGPTTIASWKAVCLRDPTWQWHRPANQPRRSPGRRHQGKDRLGLPRSSNGTEAFDLDEIESPLLLPATVTFLREYGNESPKRKSHPNELAD